MTVVRVTYILNAEMRRVTKEVSCRADPDLRGGLGATPVPTATNQPSFWRVAVTRRDRGTPAVERVMGCGNLPKSAPFSPGWTTLAIQPNSAKTASGSSDVNNQGMPAADMRSFQWRVEGQVNM